MSSNYYYYYPQSSTNYPSDPNQQWSSWPAAQPYAQSYTRPPPSIPPPPPTNHLSEHNSARTVYQSTNVNNTRHYQQRRYNSSSYNSSSLPQSWQSRNGNNYKRTRLESGEGSEPKMKQSKKKKKPLSQNVPTKRNWTTEDAEKALAVEKEFNKKFKNHSLIIKFPDLELNKEIVSKFHPAIENVHFQQPSTPRFCFVTIEKSADPDAIISVLNKQKFGDGYLTAEYKKDREEDQNIGPDDIDPLTLYVGNLAQEITKESMTMMYPKGRRIDIGYAKKMKYTRYAFVSFKCVNDSIEAFKKTHSTQLHSKSLIVRFRRLHGTVGMPGESKPQNPPKSKADESTNDYQMGESTSNASSFVESIDASSFIESIEATSIPDNASSLVESFDTNDSIPQIDLSMVKREPESDEEVDTKVGVKEFVTPFLAGRVERLFAKHKPIKMEITEELKAEKYDVCDSTTMNSIEKDKSFIKNEPPDEITDDYGDDCEDDESDEDLCSPAVNFQNVLDSMVSHKNNLSALKKSAEKINQF